MWWLPATRATLNPAFSNARRPARRARTTMAASGHIQPSGSALVRGAKLSDQAFECSSRESATARPRRCGLRRSPPRPDATARERTRCRLGPACSDGVRDIRRPGSSPPISRKIPNRSLPPQATSEPPSGRHWLLTRVFLCTHEPHGRSTLVRFGWRFLARLDCAGCATTASALRTRRKRRARPCLAQPHRSPTTPCFWQLTLVPRQCPLITARWCTSGARGRDTWRASTSLVPHRRGSLRTPRP